MKGKDSWSDPDCEEVFFHYDGKNLCVHVFFPFLKFCLQIGNDTLIYFPSQCLPTLGKLPEIYVVSFAQSECNTVVKHAKDQGNTLENRIF